MEEGIAARDLLRHAQARHRTRRHESAQQGTSRRHVRLRGLRFAAVRIVDEIRQRHGLAELFRAFAQGRGHDHGPQPRHGAHRSALRALRRAFGTCVPGRPQSHRRGLLHERCGAEIRAQVVRGTTLVLGAFLALCAMGAAQAQEMPKPLAEAAAMEQADRLPITDFYSTPSTLSATKPGDLLRKEAFAGYSLPKGATAVRILYHSLDATGQDVATSAAVLIPAGTPPRAGWPIIAWAHGTSGVGRLCPPSAMKDVYYGDEGLMPMVAAGLAVVATDYDGLGTEGAHQYVNKVAQADDVAYSIP